MGAETDKEELQYEDSYIGSGSKDGLGIKEISLKHFHKAMLEGSKEMTEGGVTRRLIDGHLVELPVPNQREIFINCVQMVRIALAPQFLSCKEEKIKEKFTQFDKELADLNKAYHNKLDEVETAYKDRNIIKNPMLKQTRIQEYNHNISHLDNALELKRVELHKKLLEALSLLLNDLGYFDEIGTVGVFDYGDEEKKEK